MLTKESIAKKRQSTNNEIERLQNELKDLEAQEQLLDIFKTTEITNLLITRFYITYGKKGITIYTDVQICKYAKDTVKINDNGTIDGKIVDILYINSQLCHEESSFRIGTGTYFCYDSHPHSGYYYASDSDYAEYCITTLLTDEEFTSVKNKISRINTNISIEKIIEVAKTIARSYYKKDIDYRRFTRYEKISKKVTDAMFKMIDEVLLKNSNK